MNSRRLQIEILEYWHAGTGRGGGPLSDAVAVRSSAGLPYLPGKTVRGLVREGVQQAEDCGLVPSGTVASLFGNARREGLLRFSSAELDPLLEKWAGTADPPYVEAFFERISGTRIDRGTGQVAEKTLRTIEVAVPLTLESTIHSLSEDEVFDRIAAGLPFVRGLGSQRRRGLGRAAFRLIEEEE